jgi:hypothetical protein
LEAQAGEGYAWESSCAAYAAVCGRREERWSVVKERREEEGSDRLTVSIPVVKFTFSSIVRSLMNALALAAASVHPPAPEMGAVHISISKEMKR